MLHLYIEKVAGAAGMWESRRAIPEDSGKDGKPAVRRPKQPQRRINNLGCAKLNRRNVPSTITKRKIVIAGDEVDRRSWVQRRKEECAL